MQDIVLVGAGHAHIEVLRSLGAKPMPGARLTLVTRQAFTPYSGMLPGLIAGLYSFDEAHIHVRPLCAFAGARLVLAEASGLDLAGKRVLCGNLEPIPFDILSIDTGSTPNTRQTPGAAEHAIAVKPVDGLLASLDAVRGRMLARDGKARICVVGGGAGGVELMLALERRLRRDILDAALITNLLPSLRAKRSNPESRMTLGSPRRCAPRDDAGDGATRITPSGLSFTLLSAGDILPAFPWRMRARFRAILAERGVEIVTGTASRVESGAVRLEGGGALTFDELFWVTEASAAPWLDETGLKLDARGFIEVAQTLESASHAGVFAAGDVASIRGFALPKAGVYAVREGPALAENLRRAASGEALKVYKPQRRILSLITTGERYAIGARNGLIVEGAWVWRWKDWIDRRFMRRYNFPAR
jgi:selenide,water dikinase